MSENPKYIVFRCQGIIFNLFCEDTIPGFPIPVPWLVPEVSLGVPKKGSFLEYSHGTLQGPARKWG